MVAAGRIFDLAVHVDTDVDFDVALGLSFSVPLIVVNFV